MARLTPDSGEFALALKERLDAAGLSRYFNLAGALWRYYSLLSKWNRTINLTGLTLEKFPGETLDRLLVEPLIAAELVVDGAEDWLDFGSGGGSPALPLKLARPSLRLTMVEANERKSAFLRECVRALQLTDVNVLTSRIEELLWAKRVGAKLVTIRAVRIETAVLGTLSETVDSGGRVLVFGPSAVPELAGFRVVDQRPLLEAGGLLVLEKA
jgi:16S rRNA (guanine527-N7)-methyltransferase